MPTRAVVFDLDDTLIVEVSFAMTSFREALATLPDVDPDASEVDALEAVRSVWRTGTDHELAVSLGFASWEGLWSTFAGNHPSLAGLETWAPTFRTEAWRAVGAVFGIDDRVLLDGAADTFEEAQRRGHPVIGGMHDVVAGVADRHPVGLITNGPSDIQRLKLEQSGLTESFGWEVISGELGIGKPDPAVFHGLLDGLGADPSASVMVGDSWERDVLGALHAGMSAVWIADGRTVPEHRARVAVIDSVLELPVALDWLA
jgi:putative hydrolase of the HAD superfamily